MARRVLGIVLVVYLLALLVFSFWPVHADTALAAWLDGFAPSMPVAGIDLGSAEYLAAAISFLLFIPLGILTAATFGSGTGALWLAFGFSLATAAGIELLQGLFVPGRTASAYDLLGAAAGAAIGVLVVAIAAAVRARAKARAKARAREQNLAQSGVASPA